MTHTLKYLLVGIALVAALLVLAVGAGLSAVKQHFAIAHLQLQGIRFTSQGLHLKSLELHQGTRRWQAEDITLNTHAVRMSKLWLWLPNPQEHSASTELPTDLSQALPRYAPRALEIEQFFVELPCQQSRCSIEGQAKAFVVNDNLELSIGLAKPRLDFALTASLRDVGVLKLKALVDGEVKATVTNQRQGDYWQGQLRLAPVAELSALTAALSPWFGALANWPALPYANAQANWQIQRPTSLNALNQSPAHVNVAIALKAPWTVPKVGELTGEFSAQLTRIASDWQAEKLTAALNLTNAPWWAAWPASVRPRALTLNLAPGMLKEPGALSLEAHLTADGPFEASLQGPLQVFLTDAPYLHTPQAQLNLKAKQLDSGDLRVDQLSVQGPVRGTISLEAGTVEAFGQWQAQAQQVRAPELSLSALGARFSPHASYLSWHDEISYQIQGELNLTSHSIHHPALKQNTWNWQGSATLDAQGATLKGTLSNGQLSLSTDVNKPNDKPGTLKAQLPSQAFSGLAKTLTAWPKALNISQGELSATLSAQWPNIKLNAQGHVKNVTGLYQTSEFTRLNGPWQLGYHARTLTLASQELSLAELNSGIGLTNLKLAARYLARNNNWQQPELEIQHASAAFLGGQIFSQNASINLARANEPILVEIQGLQIDELLKAYPAEGLSGSGTLDAILPLRISREGVAIVDGTVNARAPGGHLAFRSDKLAALAERNQAMQLTAKALDNFQFQTLRSSVALSPAGTLLLDFALSGANPDLQQGRAINLNVNLEEDLPALFKSLQLSGKVTEQIEHNVREQFNTPTTPETGP